MLPDGSLLPRSRPTCHWSWGSHFGSVYGLLQASVDGLSWRLYRSGRHERPIPEITGPEIGRPEIAGREIAEAAERYARARTLEQNTELRGHLDRISCAVSAADGGGVADEGPVPLVAGLRHRRTVGSGVRFPSAVVAGGDG